MGEKGKNAGKPRRNLLHGAVDGVPFTKENQPPPDAKKEGWQKKRAERLLTQKIIERLTEGENLDKYVKSLIENAQSGNSKAIETISKAMEDDIIKIAQTDSEGNDVPISSLPTDQLSQLEKILSLAHDSRTAKEG